MSIKQTILGAAAVVATLALGAPSQAAVITLTPVYPGTVSGTTEYSANETVDYTFTVAAPYKFTFVATGDGGNFPFPIAIKARGTAGEYTETFGPFPVYGTVDYSLTTAIPEPGVWLMMVGGFGLIGLSTRRRPQPSVA